MTNQVVVSATQQAIQDGAETGAGGHEGNTHNTDTHTDDEQPQDGSDGDSGEVKINRDVCLAKAIDGACSDKRCW